MSQTLVGVLNSAGRKNRAVKIQMKRVASLAEDTLEKKRPVEPEYPEPTRLFAHTLADLLEQENEAIAKLKQARRLLWDFKEAISAGDLRARLHKDGVYLEGVLHEAKPVDAPIPEGIITTADEVTEHVYSEIWEIITPFIQGLPWGERSDLTNYIRQTCYPKTRKNGRMPPIGKVTKIAKAVGLSKLIEYLPKLKQASDKFHTEFKPIVV